MPYVDCFLVATGISRSFRMLDPARVKLFAGKIKEYNEAHLPDNVKFLEEMLLGGYYDWFEPCNWYTLLTAKPEYGDRCDWSKFDGFDWWCIVDNVPQFADKCPWNLKYRAHANANCTAIERITACGSKKYCIHV